MEEPMKRRYLTVVISAVLFLMALGLTLYPVISNYVNQKYASTIQTAYQEILNQTDDSEIQKAKERANTYNQTLIPGTAGEGFTQEAIRSASENYVNQLELSGSGIMGYVEIPRISVNLPIYHGSDAETLERGTGHLLGSSLPVGGESTHAVITGHSGMASPKMFTDLEQLAPGDVFYLRVLDEVLAYQVEEVNKVLPHDTSLLGITPGEDRCTLVTCYPTGVNTHRLLVRGTRIPYEEAEAVQIEQAAVEEPTSKWESQYLLGLGIGALAVLAGGSVFLTVWILRRYHQKSNRKKVGRYVKK